MALLTVFAHKSYDNILRKSEASFRESDPQRWMMIESTIPFLITVLSCGMCSQRAFTTEGTLRISALPAGLCANGYRNYLS